MSESMHRLLAKAALALMRIFGVDEDEVDWSKYPCTKESIDVYRGAVRDELRHRPARPRNA